MVVAICGCDQGQPTAPTPQGPPTFRISTADIADAQSGDADAQHYLGMCYHFGHSVPQDDAVAMKWYRLAADQGLAIAQHNLGGMYRDGKRVPQDYAEAYAWFSLAALGGYADAANDRDSMAGKLTPEQLSQGQKRATELFEKISSGK